LAGEPVLVAAIAARDARVLAQLVDRHHVPMIRVALCYVDSLELAEEVVQETWLALLAGLPRFRSECSIKTWLFSILVKRARTHGLRSRRARRRALAVPAAVSGEGTASLRRRAGLREALASPAPSPEDLCLAAELRQALQAGIAGLPPRLRRIVTLRDVAGLSSSEVRKLLGLSKANQRVLLHRARCRLRRSILQGSEMRSARR
jgi:RNA polymerase sigma-70 factor (ECF subfamily)